MAAPPAPSVWPIPPAPVSPAPTAPVTPPPPASPSPSGVCGGSRTGQRQGGNSGGGKGGGPNRADGGQQIHHEHGRDGYAAAHAAPNDLTPSMDRAGQPLPEPLGLLNVLLSHGTASLAVPDRRGDATCSGEPARSLGSWLFSLSGQTALASLLPVASLRLTNAAYQGSHDGQKYLHPRDHGVASRRMATRSPFTHQGRRCGRPSQSAWREQRSQDSLRGCISTSRKV
jgi:hypothetical protein